jgi:hypothetical protein
VTKFQHEYYQQVKCIGPKQTKRAMIAILVQSLICACHFLHLPALIRSA